MCQETIIKTYLNYQELTEEQKLKVIENLSDINVDYQWHEFLFDDFTRFLELLGFNNVKINYSGFWSQGDGASFTGTFTVPKTVKELKQRVIELKKEFPTCFDIDLSLYTAMRFNKEEKENETLKVYRTSHHYCHENTVTSDNESLTDFVRDFSREIYKKLENQYDYLTSREAIEETILCNDYEFDSETLKLA